MTTKLNGRQLFTLLDFAEAYLQVEVGEESKEMLKINTQRTVSLQSSTLLREVSTWSIPADYGFNDLWTGEGGVAAYGDGVIVTGHTQEKHRRYLEALPGKIH
ncbi:hypothetical protein RB195_016957 [Necator americanus]|uniref:Reverse transcriptase domain-containing protein n=1 Tax=Necator americanus TaxID=51031 RepID=A0ABR1C2X3_NECAM